MEGMAQQAGDAQGAVESKMKEIEVSQAVLSMRDVSVLPYILTYYTSTGLRGCFEKGQGYA